MRVIFCEVHEFASAPRGATYYLSSSSRSMLKTINFQLHPRVGLLSLAVWLLVLCGPGVVAQQNNTAKPVSSLSSAAATVGNSRPGSPREAESPEIRSTASQTAI